MERLLAVNGGLGTLLESLEVPNHSFARVAGEFEVLRQFEGIGGASIFAKAAEHTAAEIVSKLNQLFAARLLIAFAGNDDEIFRAGQGA